MFYWHREGNSRRCPKSQIYNKTNIYCKSCVSLSKLRTRYLTNNLSAQKFNSNNWVAPLVCTPPVVDKANTWSTRGWQPQPLVLMQNLSIWRKWCHRGVGLSSACHQQRGCQWQEGGVLVLVLVLGTSTFCNEMQMQSTIRTCRKNASGPLKNATQKTQINANKRKKRKLASFSSENLLLCVK